MPSTKEIRGKIKSVQNTRKITKAMEMVAASKMRKAQDRMFAALGFTEEEAHRRFGFLKGHRHDNAFTRCQTVGFDDDRRAFLPQISQRRLDLGEVLVFRRRDMMTSEEIFGEGF